MPASSSPCSPAVPLGVVAAALFVAGIFVGADAMSRGGSACRATSPTWWSRHVAACACWWRLRVRFRIRFARPAPREGSADGVIEILFTASFWAAAIRIATPLIFGVLGALICERAGVLNLGIEGIMTPAPWPAGWRSGSAAICGPACWWRRSPAPPSACCMPVLTVPLGLSQHVSGIGITLLATSLTYFTYRTALPNVTSPPRIEPFRPLALPCCPTSRSSARRCSARRPLTYLAFAMVAVVAWVLYRTPLGLALRAVGDNPDSVEAQGMSVTACASARSSPGGADGGGRRLPHHVGLRRLLLRTWSTGAAGSASRSSSSPPGGRARRCSARSCSAPSTPTRCACSSLAALRRSAFPHGRHLVDGHAAPQPLGHAARGHRAVGRAQAAAHA
jgi:hypothetical protein